VHGTEPPDRPPGMFVDVGTTCTNRQLPEFRAMLSPCFLVPAAGGAPIPRAPTERTPINWLCHRHAG
jgi:hypothetical protein